MTLADVNLNEYALITNINIKDKTYSIRLQELGLYVGSVVMILNFSPLKQTYLIQIFNSVFAIKKEILNQIEVRLI